LRRLQTVGRGVSGRAGAFLHACLSHADPLGHVLNMQGQGHERSEALRLLTVMLRSLRDATDPADDAGVLEVRDFVFHEGMPAGKMHKGP
jgi:hypothetical protein